MSLIERAAKPAADVPEEAKKAAKVAATAPDSKPATKLVGKRVMFNVGYDAEFVDEIDRRRARLGMSRPAFMRLAVQKMFDADDNA